MIVSNTVPNPVNGLQDGYAVVDASLTFESGGSTRYRLGFYVDNLFDVRYKLYSNALAGLVHYTYDNDGRTIGVTAGVSFYRRRGAGSVQSVAAQRVERACRLSRR